MNNTIFIVLGGSGFLGSTIMHLLRGEEKVFMSKRGDYSNIYQGGALFPISGLNPELKCVVINCSAGRLKNREQSFESNFNAPRKYIEKIDTFFSKVTLIQVESYTQYHFGRVHDVEYVKWKNEFRDYLNARAVQKGLEVSRIVLPHLFGVGDDPNRFLNVQFRRILENKNLLLTSPNEELPLLDVQDAAEGVLWITYGRETSTEDTFCISPTQILPVFEVFQAFAQIANSNSFIEKGSDDKNIFIEPWLISEQPKNYVEVSNRTSIDSTMERICERLRHG
jgi:nucleoside-diphosphate-sugar epimerase